MWNSKNSYTKLRIFDKAKPGEIRKPILCKALHSP